MTDYKNLKLIASSSPHIRSNENTRSIMLDVIIAMLPALVWAIYNFGFKALISVVVSVVACLFWEWLYRKLLKKPQAIGDLSAVVTGMLLAFVCPPELPSAGQLCHRYDHLDPALQQEGAGRRDLHRHSPADHEGGHRGEVR